MFASFDAEKMRKFGSVYYFYFKTPGINLRKNLKQQKRTKTINFPTRNTIKKKVKQLA